MTPDLLCLIGGALHGADWRLPLSRDLDVNERTVRRWVNGEQPVPAGVAGDLLPLIEARIGRLGVLSTKLRRFL